MTQINNVSFDENLFSQIDPSIVTLYQLNEGISLGIPISNVDLLNFIKHFDDINECEDTIKNNSQKIFRLFTYGDNIETWLYNNNPIPDNVEKIIIFCQLPDDIEYFEHWPKRYTKKVENVITHNELSRELLIAGAECINRLCTNFNGNPNTLQLLTEHLNKIMTALTNSFDQEIQG